MFTDRCVAKYIQTFGVCDEAMNTISRQQAEQQAQLAQMQQQFGGPQ